MISAAAKGLGGSVSTYTSSPARTQPVAAGARLLSHFEAVCLGSCLPAFSPAQHHAAGTPTVCGYQPVPPHIAPDRQTPRVGRTSGQRRKVLFCGWGWRRWQPPEQHRQGPGAWQDNSSLPPGHICRSPRRRSLMNQVEHPATGWRDPLICTRRSTSPAPCLARRSPARLTPGRQHQNKGAGGGGETAATAPRNGGRQRLETKLIHRPPWV